MKYRLALKLALSSAPDGRKAEQKAALGWAVFKLNGKEEQTTGGNMLPYDAIEEGPGECRVVVYDKPENMLEPMPLAQHEERMRVVLATLPEDCTVVRVPFDAAGYHAWRESVGRKDTHECRAEWANHQEIKK